jgi:hypothetical protein
MQKSSSLEILCDFSKMKGFVKERELSQSTMCRENEAGLFARAGMLDDQITCHIWTISEQKVISE